MLNKFEEINITWNLDIHLCWTRRDLHYWKVNFKKGKKKKSLKIINILNNDTSIFLAQFHSIHVFSRLPKKQDYVMMP